MKRTCKKNYIVNWSCQTQGLALMLSDQYCKSSIAQNCQFGEISLELPRIGLEQPYIGLKLPYIGLELQ